MTTPGVLLPTQKGMLAGNPRDSAIAAANSSNARQANALNLLSGGNRRKNKRGDKRGGTKVPQFNTPYNPAGGPGQTPNDIITAGTASSTQQQANSVYDKFATTKGGRNKKSKTKKKRGGNPNWKWGCHSGGKTKHRRNKKCKSKRK